MKTIVGIDGCKTGWLCLTKNLDTGITTSQILPVIDDLLQFNPRPLCIATDIPIGLTDSGQRDCDRAARVALGTPRRSSVFSAPIRSMLIAKTYDEACDIGRNRDGRALSRQAWGIVPKIREMDSFLRKNRTMLNSICEIHPEVSFWIWNNRVAMVHGKKTPEGKKEREALVGGEFQKAYDDARKHLKKGQYANDDLLDAFAALWTAERKIRGVSALLPEFVGLDSEKIPIQIVA